jgi:hypothetical protein
MSQVHREKSNLKTQDLMSESSHIIEAISLDKNEVFNEVHFPKETHHQKLSETVYRDTALLYKVIKVFKSKNLTSEGSIRVWLRPAYGEDLVRRYHEEGVSKSLIQEIYEPQYKITDPKHVILFLKDHPTKKEIYILSATEGLKAESEIEKLLKNNK